MTHVANSLRLAPARVQAYVELTRELSAEHPHNEASSAMMFVALNIIAASCALLEQRYASGASPTAFERAVAPHR